MAISNFQLFLILLLLYFMFRLVYNLKIGLISFKRFAVIFSFLTIAMFVLTTSLLSYFSSMFGVNRASDFATYISIILLFFIIFKYYISIEKTRKNITELVRAIAIENALNKYKIKDKK